MDDADLIVARGTFTLNDGSGNVISKKTNGETMYFDAFNKALQTAAIRKIPMLVTNPDKVRPDEGLPPMPGAIGDSYERILGGGNEAKQLIKRIGKPFSEVYKLALQQTDGTTVDSSLVLMVGDALETDVVGGTQAQCATLWIVNDGIHAPSVKDMGGEDFEKGIISVLESFNKLKGSSGEENILCPSFVAPHFRW